MKKSLIISAIVAIVLGFAIDTTLKQSAIDIFQAKISYSGAEGCNNYSSEETKSVSLVKIRQHEEDPDRCISSIKLTSTGQATYFAVIIGLPLLLSFVLYTILKKKASTKQ